MNGVAQRRAARSDGLLIPGGGQRVVYVGSNDDKLGLKPRYRAALTRSDAFTNYAGGQRLEWTGPSPRLRKRDIFTTHDEARLGKHSQRC
jgi:hypothetical protein